jgi:DNA-binding cell septation regulator SpoVG
MGQIKVKINVFPATQKMVAMAQATVGEITIKGIRVERAKNGITAVFPSVDDGCGGEIAFITMPDETHKALMGAVATEYAAALARLREKTGAGKVVQPPAPPPDDPPKQRSADLPPEGTDEIYEEDG